MGGSSRNFLPCKGSLALRDWRTHLVTSKPIQSEFSAFAILCCFVAAILRGCNDPGCFVDYKSSTDHRHGWEDYKR